MIQNLVIFGDSIAYGAWDELGGWTDRIKIYRESQRQGSSSYALTYNMGIPGDTIYGLYQRIKNELEIRTSLDKYQNQVILSYGMNDLIPVNASDRLVSPEDFEDYYQKVLFYLKEKAIKITVLNITPINEEAGLESISGRINEIIVKYNQIIKKVCDKNSINLIDIYSIFLANNFKDLLDQDGLHPNSSGHQLIFETVVKNL